ncbi:MAG: glycosyltransferase [Nostoc sp. ChiSLP02]|nr:glycosyltransferase [Nostoc sp. DedSLP05]MDZ8099608.1 glycosyltransferase [Nostoc sp. DedSLP01]MDZ8188161.1 glycosyltransferase [Nostoc sp. ChiSLP02]
MNQGLVSVIIAIKNGERYLAAAIDSVIAQTYKCYEIIVIDGNSTDNTEKIAKSYKQVRYVSQPSQGIANAYNLGIDLAQGEFISFISHDDLWTPDKLTIQVNYLLDRPEIQYTIARVKFFLEEGFSIPPGFRPELLIGDRIAYIMETLVVRKTIFAQIGMLNPELSVAEDVDWFARASDRQVLHMAIQKVLLYKRVHDSNLSLTSSINNQNLLSILRQSIKRKRNLI